MLFKTTVFTVVVILIAGSVDVPSSLPLFFFFSLSFFPLEALGSVMRLETFLLFWRYINKIELKLN